MVEYVFQRFEMKYLLADAQRERLEELMASHMAPDEWGASTVMNVYYDTPTHLLARRSQEHPLYKEKVRMRRYGVQPVEAPVFLELKKKCEGIVYKRRATLDPNFAAAMLAGHGAPRNQIEKELDFTIRRYGGLEPAAFIAYDREAFYATGDHDFRMTFDRRVRFRTDEVSLDAGDAGELLLEDGMSLLEVKTSRAIPMWLVSFLSKEKIYKTRFSKYGAAFALMSDRNALLRSA